MGNMDNANMIVSLGIKNLV